MVGAGRIGLAVTGTHGKSTTTALLGHLLVGAGLDPTVEVGAFIAGWGASVRPGDGAPFLVEADEFGDNFLNYHPGGAIVTNVEMDHPDYFADRERGPRHRSSGSCAAWGRIPRSTGSAWSWPRDDPGAIELVRTAASAGTGASCATGPGGDVTATDVERRRRRHLVHPLRRRWRPMTLAGEHNVMNATAALIVARSPGRGPRRACARRSPRSSEPGGGWS